MDFSLYQKNSRLLRVTVTDQETGAPIDLTGYTIAWVLMSSLKGAPPTVKVPGGESMMAPNLAEVLRKASGGGGITITDAENGVFELTLSVADTENLVGQMYYEAYLEKDGGRSTVVTGVITFKRTAA